MVPSLFDFLRSRDGRWDRDMVISLFVTGGVFVLSGGGIIIPAIVFVVFKAMHAPSTVGEASFFLVFGKKLENSLPNQDYKLRLERIRKLLATSEIKCVVLMGGKLDKDKISEAKAGAAYLTKLGIPQRTKVLLEEKSLHTLENLKLTRDEFLHGVNCVVFVSNRYHLARCSILASSLGIKHILCGAEESFKFSIKNMVNIVWESILIVWFVSGKKWASITGNTEMLARIQ